MPILKPNSNLCTRQSDDVSNVSRHEYQETSWKDVKMQRQRADEAPFIVREASHGKEKENIGDIDRSCNSNAMMILGASSLGETPKPTTTNNNNSGGRWEVTYCDPKDALKKTRRERGELYMVVAVVYMCLCACAAWCAEREGAFLIKWPHPEFSLILFPEVSCFLFSCACCFSAHARTAACCCCCLF